MHLSEKIKNGIYLTFSIIFIVLIICIIAWIDRREVDKKIAEQAKSICDQKNTAQKNDNDIQGMPKISNNNLNDPSAQINTKNEAETSLKNIDNLINSVEVGNSTAQ